MLYTLLMVLGFSDPWNTAMSSLTSLDIMLPFPALLMLAKVVSSLTVLSCFYGFQNTSVGLQRDSCSSREREFIFSSVFRL